MARTRISTTPTPNARPHASYAQAADKDKTDMECLRLFRSCVEFTPGIDDDSIKPSAFATVCKRNGVCCTEEAIFALLLVTWRGVGAQQVKGRVLKPPTLI